MKKITFLLCLLMSALSFSQVVLEDFEGTEPSVTWFDDNGGASADASSTTQASSGTKSLELITAAAGQPWQGAKLLMQNNKIDMRDETTGVGTNKIVTFQLYSDTPRRFLVKLADGDLGSTTADESKTSVSHGGTGWETMTADFTVGADLGQPGYNPPVDQFSSIVFFPLFNLDTNVDGWCAGCGQNSALMTTTYIDDVTSYAGDAISSGPSCDNGIQDGDEEGVDCGGSCPNACPDPPATPTVAAPTPPARAAEDVVNVYSGAYAGSQALTATNFDVPANTSTASTGTVDGDEYWGIQYSGDNFMGFNLEVGTDASQMTHFHMDYWVVGTPTGGVMNPKLSNHSAGHLTGETNAAIHSFGPGAEGQWNSLDIEISQFNVGEAGGGISNPASLRAVLSQLVMVASGAGGALFDAIYFDNIYFHNNQLLSTDQFTQDRFKIYPNPTNGLWNVNSSTLVENVTVYDILGKEVINMSPAMNDFTIDGSNLKSGVYFAKIQGVEASKNLRLVKE
ncbi:T9SS type A sorting domain-containing protein [Winogradskyella aurantiaca]|uniref:T9SS type A sorting domain-containing protein n=1 Tax=Winogradskyella aurantiaca TaxID=2219558 RepID=UPI000E1C751A|nr:T9SS type A sorting domain-containing protein [Winogradskyella aurantiaca]